MAEPAGVAIGRLRWPVELVTRQQLADPNGTGIIETPVLPQRMHADIQFVAAETFYGSAGEQIDTPFTHRIFIRWVDYLNQAEAVIRRTLRRDGTERVETYRVRRVKELGGRKRYVLLEVEEEKSVDG